MRKQARGVGLAEVFGSERTRNLANAGRQLEGLSQGEKIIVLLQENNELLRYIANLLHEERRRNLTEGA